jgi:stage II sporulation protein R
MKNICIIFLTVVIIIVTALGLTAGQTAVNTGAGAQVEYLRLHIRAHSNADDDQWVKYQVKEDICAYLTPLVADYKTREQAVVGLEKNLRAIASVAEKTLAKKGFFYGAKAVLRRENFPTRVYENCALPAGEYLALIVELGEAKGDNWWCVVYPPLCFTSGNGDTVYASKIAEIIRSWKK